MWYDRECVPVPGQMPGTRYDYSADTGDCRIMNKLFLILAVICIVLVSPAMAKDNPYKNAHKATPADVAIVSPSNWTISSQATRALRASLQAAGTQLNWSKELFEKYLRD